MAKTRIKQVLLIFMLLIMSVCFCACGEINSSIITNSDGSVEEIVVVLLDAEEIEKTKVDINSLRSEIEYDAKAQAQAMKDRLNYKIQFDLLRTIDKETINILTSYLDGITIKESKAWNETNSYGISVKFKNIDVYKYYYNISEDSNVTMYEEKHFFYNKVYWYGNTMYLKHKELYETLKTKYETKYPSLINYENVELTYTYEADLHRLHSDADRIESYNGKYYHTWIVDEENVDQKIMFYYNIANTYNWIIVSLCATLCVTIIFSIIAIILKINKK